MPTATCRLLFVLVILAHERRRVVHVAVADDPTAAWTAQQLREAFPTNDRARICRSTNIQRVPREITPYSAGSIVAISQVGGLHHRYERRAEPFLS